MLEIHNLNFSFQRNQTVLSDINFRLKKGEILSVLGESGSGKSTLLKLIYGLEDVASGQILYNEKVVTGPKFNLVPGHPQMKFVPQEFDLLDSITVGENVGKYLSNFDLPYKRENIIKALEVVKMDDLMSEVPSKLSGGQRQRVSIARALATNPEMLLLDEPYSHLDQPLKFEIRRNIWTWAKETNCTLILTSHDSNDALGFSDQVVILKNGRIMQQDPPEKLRNQPTTEYVAGLLGEYSVLNSEAMKILFQTEIPENKIAIIYPEEISKKENGQRFEITDVRYRGRDYLVEAEESGYKVKFYLRYKPESKTIHLTISNYRLV